MIERWVKCWDVEINKEKVFSTGVFLKHHLKLWNSNSFWLCCIAYQDRSFLWRRTWGHDNRKHQVPYAGPQGIPSVFINISCGEVSTLLGLPATRELLPYRMRRFISGGLWECEIECGVEVGERLHLYYSAICIPDFIFCPSGLMQCRHSTLLITTPKETEVGDMIHDKITPQAYQPGSAYQTWVQHRPSCAPLEWALPMPRLPGQCPSPVGRASLRPWRQTQATLEVISRD